MLTDELVYQITEELGLQPTRGQQHVMETFAHFVTTRTPMPAMILRGSAGTGKTTLAAAMVRTMVRMKQQVVLLAPTGRAAKVFAQNAGLPAYTIHRRIYRQKSLEGGFTLGYNMQRNTLFFVDEASMIANQGSADSIFGNGRLLDDLVSYVYSGQNCRMVLIGDKAQLPPVGEEESPALSAETMRSYGLDVVACDLDEVLRQSQTSGILWNATRIRKLNENGKGLVPSAIPIRFSGFNDIVRTPGDELIESIASSYSHVGIDETMIVTRSNKRANAYNQGIRNMILGREEELTTGDRLMIVKNNYYWAEIKTTKQDGDKDGGKEQGNDDGKGQRKEGLTFIANGDMAVVRRIRNIRELYGFRFADVLLTFPDYDDEELLVTVLLDTLQSEAPALTREQQTLLYNNVLADYSDIPRKRDRMDKLRNDPYYNALQVKFAYAVTCHKAQGGQWAHVYLDQGFVPEDTSMTDYLHWLYTAFTRATDKLYLVNWKNKEADA